MGSERVYVLPGSKDKARVDLLKSQKGDKVSLANMTNLIKPGKQEQQLVK